jgi:hypothetical protein
VSVLVDGLTSIGAAGSSTPSSGSLTKGRDAHRLPADSKEEAPMRLPRVVVCLLFASALPTLLRAQSFNLRDLLTDFLREGITLAPPTTGISHEAHFNGADSPQFLALQQFNSQIANQLSSFPLASSAGGFIYTFDPSLGVFVRASDSFGPVYAERADTIGKGRFNLGLNFSHFTFDRVNDLSLRDGDLRLVFTHKDVNNDGSNLEPYVEGDVITARLFLKIQTDITAFVLNYGAADRLDIGVAIPVVRVSIDAQTDATIDRLATGANSQIHRFLNGTTAETFRQSGSASGVGDIVLRAKYRVTSNTGLALAVGSDVRLPTGNERDQLGTGSTQLKTYLIGSAHFGTFSPHLNAGYTWSLHPADGKHLPDEISYTGGFDLAVSPRLTLVADVLGRTFRKTQIVRIVDATFRANTNPDPKAPPDIVYTVLPELTTTKGDLSTLLGSVGFKINPVGNLLLTVNGLFSIRKKGLVDNFTPLVGVDYSF